ncbi:MAG TPA: LuxR C-terminal-related transcriptional regulator [Candidatus Dormibacteraeota bacterium]|nr:LuxR C-terminal-related transcriptional regulator [Candidatus Dormibacteraeota bacterium]
MRVPEGTAHARPTSIVARPALFDRLSSGLRGGVILLSAPAGSGKTQLLRSWIAADELADATAWVSVERDEKDPQRFWLSVVAALRDAGVRGGLDDLRPAPDLDGRAVVERVSAATTELEAPLLLVIDDVHQLAVPAALDQLEQLLSRRPPQLRLVLSTRHDPPVGLHRLRLAGELTEIRAPDLRFQLAETKELLAAAGIELSDEAIGSLLARTEGWVAGLRLAALSLAGRPDPERFIAEFSGSERTVADYLFTEVLERQEERVRDLLLRTSILERVSGPLADRLLGTKGSERLLLEVETTNGFVYSIDTERTWFRYHHLFGDLLRLELRRTEPEAIPALHHAAAEWLGDHGSPVEAVRHAQAAGDWRLAGDLLAQHAFSLALDGSFATLRALLAPFPPEAFENPELAAFLAYGEVIRPSLDTAASYIALAERHADEVPAHRRPQFRAMMATTRLTLARWTGDYAAAIREARPLLESAEPESIQGIVVENDVKAVALMSLGIVELWAGAAPDDVRDLRAGAELARRIGRPYIEQGCLAHLALSVGRYDIPAGRELALQAMAILERFGWLSEPVAPMVLASLGVFDAVQGRFDDAGPWLDRAERALQRDAEPPKELFLRFSRGVQRLGQGRLADAIALFAETRGLQALLVDPDPLTISSRALQVQALVRLGDLPAARALLEAVPPDEPVYVETLVARAAVHLAEGQPRAATEVLVGGAPAGPAPMRLGFTAVNALVVDALAHDAIGDGRAAEDRIEAALDLAEPQALIFPFLITPARELLERHPAHRTAHAALLADILDVLAGSSPAARTVLPEVLEPLTESELRVLRFLPSNLSAPEIAAEVFLSTSTVKTHMRHIYEKLGAHKRSEAVDAARALGLLAPSSRSRR